jgi:SAM-dependent methyltransferase
MEMSSNEKIIGAIRFRATIDVIKSAIRKDSLVLEIGSNDASFRSCFNCKDWFTIDKYGNPDIHIDINDLGVKLPFESGSCDVIICTEVLEHLTSGSPFVKEMARVLKPSGCAIISVPNIASIKSRIKVFFGEIPNMAASGDCGPPLGGTGVLSRDGHWVAGHVVDFNLKRLRMYLERSGFKKFQWYNVPVNFRFFGFRICIPGWLSPRSFSDFILVNAGISKS